MMTASPSLMATREALDKRVLDSLWRLFEALDGRPIVTWRVAAYAQSGMTTAQARSSLIRLAQKRMVKKGKKMSGNLFWIPLEMQP